jgi:hypothetical protein
MWQFPSLLSEGAAFSVNIYEKSRITGKFKNHKPLLF